MFQFWVQNYVQYMWTWWGEAKLQLFCADESSLTTSDSFAEEGVVGVRSLAMTWLHPCQWTFRTFKGLAYRLSCSRTSCQLLSLLALGAPQGKECRRLAWCYSNNHPSVGSRGTHGLSSSCFMSMGWWNLAMFLSSCGGQEEGWLRAESEH